MSGEDELIERVVEMKRLLAGASAQHARFTDDAADGILLVLAEDPDWWLELVPQPGGDWLLSEVGQLGAHLGPHRRELSTLAARQAPGAVETEYRRLLLERRNAGCGTPTRPG